MDAAVAGTGEEGAERLPAADLGGGDDERRGLARGKGELGSGADRADVGRAVEGGAELVVQERRAEGAEAREERREAPRASRPGAGAGVAGEADGAGLREAREVRRGRRVEE